MHIQMQCIGLCLEHRFELAWSTAWRVLVALLGACLELAQHFPQLAVGRHDFAYLNSQSSNRSLVCSKTRKANKIKGNVHANAYPNAYPNAMHTPMHIPMHKPCTGDHKSEVELINQINHRVQEGIFRGKGTLVGNSVVALGVSP